MVGVYKTEEEMYVTNFWMRFANGKLEVYFYKFSYLRIIG